MVDTIKDLCWWLFGKSADAYIAENKTCPGIAGLLRWAETDYFSYAPDRRKWFTFTGGQRILQPGE